MLRDVIEVRSVGDYRLWLRFDNDVEGEVDLGPMLSFEGVFAPLKDQSYFAKVGVNDEVGTVTWPSGADWDSLVLYSLVTGRPVEELLTEGAAASR